MVFTQYIPGTIRLLKTCAPAHKLGSVLSNNSSQFCRLFSKFRGSCSRSGILFGANILRCEASHSNFEDNLLQAASTLASSGISPEGLEAFSNSTVPCNLRCTISGLAGDEVNDLADILLSFGASSTSISEHRADGEPEQEIMVDGKWTPKQLWDRCSLTALFPVEVCREQYAKQVEGRPGGESPAGGRGELGQPLGPSGAPPSPAPPFWYGSGLESRGRGRGALRLLPPFPESEQADEGRG
uniref:Uncharacterized protein n=1 Tax=Tetraselmis sp. GSL018 TaxID=582737 RepID=A0A061RIM4_9CHLO